MILGGFLSPIEDPLTWLLERLHENVGLPWAWSIVALTLIVRMLLVPVTVRQIHSMQRLQVHAPQMKELQKKYAHDKQRRNEELMKFYKENKINPAASCLPMLLQIPIFIALFFVLRDFEKEVFPEYRAKGETPDDLHWLNLIPNITDGITEHWSGFLLLAIYVVSQIASTYYMSATAEKTQRMIMMALPVVFIFFIIDPPGSTVFPVGLLIYWMTTNLWTVGQGVVTRRLVPRKALPAPKRAPRPKEDRGPDGGDGAKPAKRPQEKPPPVAASTGPRKVKRKKAAKKARR